MGFRGFFSSILFIFYIGHANAQSMDLYAFSDTKSNGEMASIDIRVNDFTDIISFQASINWDPEKMTLTGVDNFAMADFNEENFGDASADQGHLRFVWDPEDATPRTLFDSTVLFTANFELASTDPDPISVGFVDETSIPPFPTEFVNSKAESLTVNTYEGSIVYEPMVTGLDQEYETKTILISPNPFVGPIKISAGDATLDFVKVYDISGQLVTEKLDIKRSFTNINLNASPNGIYLVKMRTNGKILTKKIIKNTSN